MADGPDALRSYLTQTRQELGLRLADRLYAPEPQIGADGQPTGQAGARANKPSKWWMSFQKRRYGPFYAFMHDTALAQPEAAMRDVTDVGSFMGRTLGA